METKCRFPACQWTGDSDNIFGHCETYHSKFIKEINNDEGFSFTLEEILKDTFLLNGADGLYWFLFDPKEDENGIRRGVFAIGESEICKYTTKVGRLNDGYAAYIGPLQIQPETSDKYEFEWSDIDLIGVDPEVHPKSIQMYFREFEDPEVYTGTYDDVNWEDPEEEKYNMWCLEKFTCYVCYEYIKSNARFCENRHFLCNECLTKLKELNKLKCPMCKGDFPYDCTDEEVEELLRCVRFPDSK